MMKSNVEYGLRGAFKVDTYDAKGNFIETSDWFDNFITQTGLMYPTMYSFANCFRFLTIGSSNASNEGGLNGVNTDTRACYTPILTYATSDGKTQRGTWIGYEGLETGDGTSRSSCLTRIDGNGIRFFRSWSIPTGAHGITVNEPGGFLNVQEFAVSPDSGADFASYPGDNDGNCIGRWAFSRVQRTLPIKNGYRVVISYQLQVNCLNYTPTNITGAVINGDGNFLGGTFDTGSADVTNDYDLIEQWARLSGYYRQVWPGLSCVDYYGATFIPKYGNGMEPYLTDLSNYCIYFSPDNAAFDVNDTGAGFQSSATLAWDSRGVMTPITQSMTLSSTRSLAGLDDDAMRNIFYGPEAMQTAIPSNVTPYNIRLGSKASSATALFTPYVGNYKKNICTEDYINPLFNYQQSDSVNASAEPISYATPGASGLDTEREVDNQQKAIFSTNIYRLPMDMDVSEGHAPNYNSWTGRRKTVTRRALFSPAHSLGYNTRFGSMVFAYLADTELGEGQYIYYPIIDSLFYDNSGRALMQHYRLISGIYLTQRGSGVASCQVTIRHDSPNGNEVPSSVVRHISRRTFQGACTGMPQTNEWITDGPNDGQYGRAGNLISGDVGTGIVGVGGWPGDFHWQSDSYGGCSGWGAVVGFLGDDYNSNALLYYDMGVADHNTGSLVEPTAFTGAAINLSQLYWPYFHQGGGLYVDFHNIVFRKSNGDLWPDDPSLSSTQIADSYGFCRPTGYIWHFDSIGEEGGRLLPNHGMATTSTTTNTYTPAYGGSYPAFSSDNGLEVYLDISWSSDCKGTAAKSCIDPP